MSIALDIHKERRVVMVRWTRATHGDPSPDHPEVDDRGSRSPEFSGIVGMMEGKTAFVRLIRQLIDPAADLFIKSSAEANVAILEPADGKLPAGAQTDIKLSGVAGGDPNEATLEVHFGSATGPIISKLLVRCFVKRRVRITPHLVTIHDPTGANGTPSTANVANIMTHVQAIWRACGVEFVVGATLNETLNFATANVVSDTTNELKTLLATNHVANTINAYFVRQIGAGTVLGYGFSRPSSVQFGMGNPGIVLGDQAGVWVHDTPWAGNDLAHESGHFFQLWHPNNQQPPHEREDTWSRRFLMHNNNTQNPMNNWKDDNGYGSLPLGAGHTARRGALLTHKHIQHIATDNESHTARAAILAGPY